MKQVFRGYALVEITVDDEDGITPDELGELLSGLDGEPEIIDVSTTRYVERESDDDEDDEGEDEVELSMEFSIIGWHAGGPVSPIQLMQEGGD